MLIISSTIKRLLLMLIIVSFTTSVIAASPLISITLLPGSRAQQVIPNNGATIIKYRVTNNSYRGITFQEKPMPGVIDLLDNEKSCNVNQSLAGHDFCFLTLLVLAEQLPRGGVHGGPELISNPFWGYQPTSSEQINVSTTETPAPITLSSVSGLALSVKNTALNAALTGVSRQLVITNTSNSTATNVRYVVARLPSDASISPARCGDIASGQTCTLTVTPGATAISTSLYILSDDEETNELTVALNILSYGSQYQGGYVFSIDDTTPTTQSVGGTVAALSNQALLWPLGIIWASNGVYDCAYVQGSGPDTFANCTSYVDIPGINEVSTSPPDACNGNSDGTCNTAQIVNYFTSGGALNEPILLDKYAAGLCKATIEGYSDWYLPAICEMGYYVPGSQTPTIDSGCGTQSAPAMQNMLSNLANLSVGNLFGVTWSSTEYSHDDGTYNNAWSQYFLGQNSYQTHDGKENTSGVRCVRALTQPQ